jgi:hypothetical protein
MLPTVSQATSLSVRPRDQHCSTWCLDVQRPQVHRLRRDCLRSDRCYRSRCCHHSSEPRCDPFALANLASSRFQHPCCWAATLPRSTGVDTQHTIHNIKSEEDTQSNETSSSQGSPGSLYSTLILESAKQVLRITPLSSIYHVVLIHR